MAHHQSLPLRPARKRARIEDEIKDDPVPHTIDTQELRDALDADNIDEMLPMGANFGSQDVYGFHKRDLSNKIAIARAANLTFHDISVDDEGFLWIPGLANRPANRPAYRQDFQPAPVNRLVIPLNVVISPKIREQLDTAVRKYLKYKPHHVVYNRLLAMYLASAPSAAIAAAVFAAVDEVQLATH